MGEVQRIESSKTLPWEEPERPEGFDEQTWKLWRELRQAMKAHDWEKVKAIGVILGNMRDA